jgi:hypothetical protein
MKTILLMATIAAVCVTPQLNRRENRLDLTAPPNGTHLTLPCVRTTDLTDQIIQLSRPNEGERSPKEFLLNKARISAPCHATIANAIVSALDRSNRDLTQDETSFLLWRNACDLLGDMHATEALDFLTKNLVVTDGLSISLSHYPAVSAVIKIGAASIPALNTVLTQNADSHIRKFAAVSIASIGGYNARKTLEAALLTEKDQCVSDFIKISLNAFDNKQHPNHVMASSNAQWLDAFYFCRH